MGDLAIDLILTNILRGSTDLIQLAVAGSPYEGNLPARLQ